jgi:hypothetical protein
MLEIASDCSGPELARRTTSMNRRFIPALFALSLSAVAACGGDHDDEGASSSALALSGTYRPVDQGSIGSIAFEGGKDYRLVPAACSSTSCVETGSYRLDTAQHALVLTDARTQQTRTIAFEVIETSNTSAALVSTVRPLDLVDPGEQLTKNGQETTTGNGQKLNEGSGQQLNGAASQLLQLVQQAMMNGQQMKRDAQADNGGGGAGAKIDPKPEPPKDPKAPPPADPEAPKNP